MVLRNSGRVGSCRFIRESFSSDRKGLSFFVMARSFPSSLPPCSLHYDNKYVGYADYTGNRNFIRPAAGLPDSVVSFGQFFLLLLALIALLRNDWEGDYGYALRYVCIGLFPVGSYLWDFSFFRKKYHLLMVYTLVYPFLPNYSFFPCYCYLGFLLFFRDRSLSSSVVQHTVDCS